MTTIAQRITAAVYKTTLQVASEIEQHGYNSRRANHARAKVVKAYSTRNYLMEQQRIAGVDMKPELHVNYGEGKYYVCK